MPSRQRSRPILLTGFEPFGSLARNPSADAVRRLARDPALRSLGLRTAVLPVSRSEAPARLDALLERLRPRALILTGVAVGRAALSVERIAINCWRAPRERGAGRPIRAGGPDGLFSTLPLERVVRALGRDRRPALISDSAGTYACNLVLYWALLRREDDPELCPDGIGFIHVPATPGSGYDGRGPTLALGQLVDALESIVRDLYGPTRHRPLFAGSRGVVPG